MEPLIVIFLIINTIAFILYGSDKIYAIKDKERISEKKLHIISALGGLVGSALAMVTFRHKIKKTKFLLIEFFIGFVWVLSLIHYYYYTKGITCLICQVF